MPFPEGARYGPRFVILISGEGSHINPEAADILLRVACECRPNVSKFSWQVAIDTAVGATVALQECMLANISSSNGVLSGVSGRGAVRAVMSVDRCASLLVCAAWGQTLALFRISNCNSSSS
jgi:hypothetical protein